MPKKIVLMPMIPGTVRRRGMNHSRLDYARFGKATWQWWCEQNKITFVAIEEPLGGSQFAHLPPTIQRWLAPAFIARQLGNDCTFAVVDADTMIRWDTPDFFDIAQEEFAAVRGVSMNWMWETISAHQHLFPGINLPWWEYFNAGVVVLNSRHFEALREFSDFAASSWAKLQVIQAAGDVGTDQTPLNFTIRKLGITVRFLPPIFNCIGCFPLSNELSTLEHTPGSEDLVKLRVDDKIFRFIEFSYVWHFSNTVRLRYAAMQATWQRVRTHYRGSTALT